MAGPPLPLQIGQAPHENVRVPIAARRAPIVEVERELTVTSDHEVRLQTDARETVVTSRAPVIPQRRLGHRVGPLRRVILDTDAARDACADGGAGHYYAVVVVNFHPVVVDDADLRGVAVVDPERLHAARKRG